MANAVAERGSEALMLQCSMRVVALTMAAAMGLWGCGKSAPQEADTAAAPAPATADGETPAPTEDAAAAVVPDVGTALAPVEPPTVTLLDAGVEPRVALRLTPVAGSEEATRIAMRMAVAMTLDGQAVPGRAMPRARLGLGVKIDAVAADGAATWSVVITEAAVDDAAGGAAAPDGETSFAGARGLQEGLAAVKGLTAAGRVSDRGVTTLAGFAGGQAEGEMATLLEGFRESLVQLAVPLPEEPVGAGARWQVEQVVAQSGMRIRQTTVFDVVSIEGSRVVARVTLVQAAEPGADTGEALPPGARLEGFSGSGTGETTLDLGRILPVSSTAQVKTTVKMTVPAPDGGGRAMEMTMDIGLALGAAVDEAEPEVAPPTPEPDEPVDGSEDAPAEPEHGSGE
ncbi:MAG: hypothetical protein CVU56_13920 [Deltaproteobacteria bacterium HGW-Deltaproteobacteria-14]|jgi:hypothetical protein|nr:MAG: hypothetical protein CVU56_13920 [Deltaproteobacteria bacterium HGW-Deltaproteobacteria-14]